MLAKESIYSGYFGAFKNRLTVCEVCISVVCKRTVEYWSVWLSLVYYTSLSCLWLTCREHMPKVFFMPRGYRLDSVYLNIQNPPDWSTLRYCIKYVYKMCMKHKRISYLDTGSILKAVSLWMCKHSNIWIYLKSETLCR